jgi:hypothetical protein
LSSTLTPSATSQYLFLPQHFAFKIAATQADLDAASEVSIKSAKLSINHNIEDDDVLGTLSANDFLNKQLTIEGQIELKLGK